MSGARLWAVGSACGVALTAATPACAGPPYVTDDPEPTDLGHWEVYGFASGVHTPGETAGESGLDFNYGAARDLQLTVVVPAAYDDQSGASHVGMGVVELAAKYKILHERPGAWTPSIAVFPRLFVPTAKARFASKRANLLLPVWVGKTFGAWSAFA